jgi:hypothetical protein
MTKFCKYSEIEAMGGEVRIWLLLKEKRTKRCKYSELKGMGGDVTVWFLVEER